MLFGQGKSYTRQADRQKMAKYCILYAHFHIFYVLLYLNTSRIKLKCICTE